MPETTPTLSAFFEAWDLFREPALAGAVAGALLGMLGIYVVLRRMVFLSAALSQSASLGVSLAWFAQVRWSVPAWIASPTTGGTAASLLAAGAMLAGRSSLSTRRDGVLGWVYLLGAAGTLAVGTRIVQEVQDIETLLFGSGVAVRPEDFTLLVQVSVVIGLLHLWLHRGFIQVATDQDGARVRGLPTRLVDALLIVSLAVAVSVGTRILGALPVFAFTVLPAMAALGLAVNVPQALPIAALVGGACGFGGYLVAYRYRLPVGASQTLVAALAVAAVHLLQRALAAIVALRNRQRHDHNHEHGPDCGHPAVPHGDHVDYLVGGHLHHPDAEECHDHGPLAGP